jgi:hypothetical protein
MMSLSPGKQWDQDGRFGRHCHSPRLRALVTSRISREQGKSSRQLSRTSDPCLHVVRLTWEAHANTGGVSDGASQGRKAAGTKDGATMER